MTEIPLEDPDIGRSFVAGEEISALWKGIGRATLSTSLANHYRTLPPEYSYSPEDIGWEPESLDRALGYAASLFPGRELRLLSNEGSSAVVLEDDEAHVFKVMRDAHRYSYYEDEMGALTLLSDLGLAPRPFVLVDAALEFRTEQEGIPEERNFGDIPILRVKGGGKYPVIVMEKVDFNHKNTMTDGQRIEAFDTLLSVFEANRLVAGDTELVVDKHTGKPIFIDVGGFGRIKLGKRLEMMDWEGNVEDLCPDLTDEQAYTVRIIDGLLLSFMTAEYKTRISITAIGDILTSKGVSAFHKVITNKNLEAPELIESILHG